MTWLIGAAVLLLAILFLCLHIKAEISIVLRDDRDWQGIVLKITSRFYKMDHSYECTDPHLNLLEVILFSAYEARRRYLAMEKMSRSDPGMSSKIFLPRVIRSLLKRRRLIALLNFTTFDKLEWVSIVGGNDAHDAAIRSGVLWGIKGSMLGWLKTHSKIDNSKVFVRPNFSNPDYKSSFKCILKMRLVHIIIIGSFVIALKVRWCINGFRTNPAQSPY